jgi:hypothetical protein
MGKDFDNTNRGVLFKNEDKKAPNHPDYKGKLDVAGTEFWLSAWIKEGKSGKFMSLSITPKETKAIATPAADAKKRPVQDDSIPF